MSWEIIRYLLAWDLMRSGPFLKSMERGCGGHMIPRISLLKVRRMNGIRRYTITSYVQFHTWLICFWLTVRLTLQTRQQRTAGNWCQEWLRQSFWPMSPTVGLWQRIWNLQSGGCREWQKKYSRKRIHILCFPEKLWAAMWEVYEGRLKKKEFLWYLKPGNPAVNLIHILIINVTGAD